MTRVTTLLADWTALNPGSEAALAEGTGIAQAFADALLRACAALTDEMLRSLPATPDDAAAALTSDAFAGRAEGCYLPVEWMESFCTALRLPIAELDSGYDISDGEDVYFLPRVQMADDPDAPDDTRAYVRVDAIRRWSEPRP